MTPNTTNTTGNESNDCSTTAVDFCEIFVGVKTTEASNNTGGKTEQLKGGENCEYICKEGHNWSELPLLTISNQLQPIRFIVMFCHTTF